MLHVISPLPPLCSCHNKAVVPIICLLKWLLKDIALLNLANSSWLMLGKAKAVLEKHRDKQNNPKKSSVDVLFLKHDLST